MKKSALVAGITASATAIANVGTLAEAVAVQQWPVLEAAPDGTVCSLVVAALTAALAWVREVGFGSRIK